MVLDDTLEEKFSNLGSSVHKLALYKGLLSLRDEIDQELHKTQFLNPVIGIAALTTLQVEIDDAIKAIERVLEKKHELMFDEVKKHEAFLEGRKALDNTYMSQKVADILGVSTSALRKWSPSLERMGYRFMRDEHDRRLYRERDLAALRHMSELLQSGMGMDDAAKSVAGLFEDKIVPR